MFERSPSILLLLTLLAGCSSDKSGTPSATASTPVAAEDAGDSFKPLEGTARFSMTMDPFTIKPSQEFYKCQDFPNPAGKDIAILQSQTVMTRGSHHMFAFRIDTTTAKLNLAADGSKGPLVDCPSGGVEFHPYFHDAQIPTRVISYPEGVGRSLKATEGVRLMVHYLNTTPDDLNPTLSVTADYVNASAVTALAAEYFLSAASVMVKPGQSTQTFSFTVPSDIHLLSSVSHMHSHGTGFEADAIAPGDTGGGTPLYQSTAWLEPVPNDFSPPKDVAAGTVFRFSCSYDNKGTKTYTFGESAVDNEMCIFQGTFYPAAGGSGLIPFMLQPSE